MPLPVEFAIRILGMPGDVVRDHEDEPCFRHPLVERDACVGDEYADDQDRENPRAPPIQVLEKNAIQERQGIGVDRRRHRHVEGDDDVDFQHRDEHDRQKQRMIGEEQARDQTGGRRTGCEPQPKRQDSEKRRGMDLLEDRASLKIVMITETVQYGARQNEQDRDGGDRDYP